jgi:hypothetical protein
VTDPQQDDLTAEADNLVQNTGNGQQPDDPIEQPSQDPAALPEGTETAEEQQ